MLRRKSLFIVTISSFLIFIMIYFTLQNSMDNDFKNLELELSNLYFRLLKNDINFSTEALNRIAVDWAKWDDTYYFIKDKNQDTFNSYIERNLTDEILYELDIDFMVFFNNEKELIYEIHKEEPLANYHFLFNLLKDFDTNRGVLSSHKKDLIIFSAWPITDSTSTMEPVGTLLIGYFLNEERILTIEKKLGYNFDILGISSREEEKVSIKIDNNIVTSRYYIDILNNQSLIIRSYREAQILEIGNDSFRRYIYFLLIYFSLLITLLAFLINKFIIKKLNKLEVSLIRIIRSNNLNKRVEAIGKDEIGILGLCINTLLEKIEEKNKKLYKLATFDSMTGIYNREVGLKILEQKLMAKTIIVFIDINNLKYVNDTFSHEEGDFLIKTIVDTIKNSLSSTHTFLRLGGDEFLVGINDLSLVEVEELFKDIKIKLKNCKEKSYEFSVSVGIISNSKRKNLDELINLADIAMYSDKRKSKRQNIL